MFRRVSLFVAVVAPLLLVTGCGGSKLSPVSGVVSLDGTPVAEAGVTFISEDGKKTFASVTDASGKYTMSVDGKPGLPAGNYKVLVMKQKKMEGDVTPGSADYMKGMAK